MIRCEDDSIYTGITTDVKRRFNEHKSQNGTGAKYTRSHKPVCIEAVWSNKSRSEASRLEFLIKHLSRSVKLRLIKNPDILTQICSDKLPDCNFVFEERFSGMI